MTEAVKNEKVDSQEKKKEHKPKVKNVNPELWKLISINTGTNVMTVTEAIGIEGTGVIQRDVVQKGGNIAISTVFIPGLRLIQSKHGWHYVGQGVVALNERIRRR